MQVFCDNTRPPPKKKKIPKIPLRSLHRKSYPSLRKSNRFSPMFSILSQYILELVLCRRWADIKSPPLFPSALSSHPVHCALQNGFGQTWWTRDVSLPLHFASLYGGHEVFVWSDYLLDHGTDFLVGNMVFVSDAWYHPVASHFHGLYSSLELCCEGSWITGKQEDGCDQGAHQSYLGTEGNAPIIRNCFQPCQYCCLSVLESISGLESSSDTTYLLWSLCWYH